MKFFNLEGTTQNSFSIGTGKEKVELRTINGKLFYRNYNSGWIEIRDTDSSIPDWQPNHIYDVGQLFTRQNSLWYVKENHTSSSIFSGSIRRVAKIAEYSNIEIFDVSLQEEFSTNAEDSLKIIFEGAVDTSIIKSRKYSLPNATHLERGNKVEIQNNSNTPIEIYLNDESTFFTLLKKKQYIIATLKNRPNANGDWTFFNVGSGSGFLTQTEIKTLDYLSEAGELVIVDTSVNNTTFSVILPEDPLNDDKVGILDIGGYLSEVPVILDRNGRKIQNEEENWIIDANDVFISFIYNEFYDSWFFLEAPIAGYSGRSSLSSGGSTDSLEFDIVGDVFTVNHDLNYYPIVQLFNSSMQRIEGEIRHLSKNTFEVTLNSIQQVKVVYK